MHPNASLKTSCIGRALAFAAAGFLSLGAPPSLVAQTPNERGRQTAEAWRNGTETVLDAMDLERRYVEWVAFLADDRIAGDASLVPHRDDLIAELRDSMPWDSVRTMHRYAFLAAALDAAEDVEAPGVQIIVDDIVAWIESPLGSTALDVSFPPRDTLFSADAVAEYERMYTQEVIAEQRIFAETYAGRILSSFFTFAKWAVWDELLAVSRRVFARSSGGGPG